MEIATISDRETSEDDHHCTDESEYGSDDECIDILNGNSDALSPASEEQKEESCDGVGSAHKFSIDTILGLKSKENECGKSNDDLKCSRETKFIKPTPLPALPRGNHNSKLSRQQQLFTKCFILIQRPSTAP